MSTDPLDLHLQRSTERMETRRAALIRVLLADLVAREDALPARVRSDNASAQAKLGRVYALVDEFAAHRAPHVACQRGCADCCRMNVQITSPEAARIAAGTSRPARDLTQSTVYALDKFAGQACPFLVDNACSIYDLRPFVCRHHASFDVDAYWCDRAVAAHRCDRPQLHAGRPRGKKRQIREQSKADGVFERNRRLAAPWDHRALLVVSPPRATELGDFARDADHLQRPGLCEAVYAHSRFEGEGATALIRGAIQDALAAWSGPAMPDAIVIIRGGGAVNDLAWLNDYELACFVCLSPVPVLTGIGHERDNTVLDEVAHQRFDTPSKVVAGIQALIVARARESQAIFSEMAGLTLKHMRTAEAAVDQLDAGIRRQAVETITRAGSTSLGNLTAIQQHAQRALHEASQGALRAMGDVRVGASSRLATARVNASSVATQVTADAVAAVREARMRNGDLLQEVDRAARNALHRGAEAAEAAFREVVAQGPEKTLARGFAVVHNASGQIVTSAAAAAGVASVRLQFQDGSIEASVRRGGEKKP